MLRNATISTACACLAGLLWIMAGTVPAFAGGGDPPRRLTFEDDVLPILQARCFKCHGELQKKGNLDLRRRFTLLAGGDSGAGIVPGKPEESPFIERIAEGSMPPKEEGALDAKQIALLTAWVKFGAPIAGKEEPPLEVADAAETVSDADRQFWSFQPPKRPPIPAVKNVDRVRTPVDAFLLARLEAQGLAFNPDADRLTLIRRLCFDLHGLPPTPEQAAAFLADDRPDAYERLVDSLLSSPRYGERWGRHWLDVAGYADSDGYLEADRERPEAWRYRDYVIRAFNADKPYDRFLTEQIAGDELHDWRRAAELTPEMEECLVATGFLRTAADPTYPGYKEPLECHKVMADTAQIVSSALLGVTLQCARCHAHKSDPFTQRDYYQLQAILVASYDPGRWLASGERFIPLATESQQAAVAEHNRAVDARIAPLNQQLAELRKAHREKAGNDKADDAALAKQFPEFKAEFDSLTAAVAAENAQKKSILQLRGLIDIDDKPPQARVLRRGDFNTPGANVEPGLPAVLVPTSYDYKPVPGYKTTGRRTALAKWLADPQNPLTARVHANRVWAHHFGRGLVPTLDQFGHSGEKPSHPELLDWLAVELAGIADCGLRIADSEEGDPNASASAEIVQSLFSSSANPQSEIRNPQSLKRLHRLILHSTAYRQSSAMNAQSAAVDPDNVLLWAWRPRRHEGEVVRDTLLALAGKLNGEMFGPPVQVSRQGDGQVVVADDSQGNRRSVYLKVRRSQPVTFLELFDTPRMEVNCTQRTEAIVATQALTLSNSRFVEVCAAAFAQRLLQSPDATDADGRIALAWELCFTRPPTETERTAIREFLDAAAKEKLGDKFATATPEDLQQAGNAAWPHVALALFNSNEFLFVP